MCACIYLTTHSQVVDANCDVIIISGGIKGNYYLSKMNIALIRWNMKMNIVTTGKNHVDLYNNYDIHVYTPEQYVSGELYMHVDSKRITCIYG